MSEQSETARQSLPEKITLIVSALIVLGLAGYLAWHAFAVPVRPALVEARVLTDRAARRGEQWTVPVVVRNQSDRPVEAVEVTVEMVGADGKKTEKSLSVAYLPERGSEVVRVVLEQEPARSRPEARVDSFKEPRDSAGY